MQLNKKNNDFSAFKADGLPYFLAFESDDPKVIGCSITSDLSYWYWRVLSNKKSESNYH